MELGLQEILKMKKETRDIVIAVRVTKAIHKRLKDFKKRPECKDGLTMSSLCEGLIEDGLNVIEEALKQKGSMNK